MTALVLDPIYKAHETAWDHPESPERLGAIEDAFRQSGLLDRTSLIPPRPATLEQIALAHDPAYADEVLRTITDGEPWLAGGDVSVCRRSGEVALLAAGGVIAAVDAVLSSRAANAFCAVRPPGHHATADQAMGFCIFNNVAVAARYAQKMHGIERVAILDWDVHHGNGTQDIFYSDGSVLFCSTHQSPWYPGTGAVDECGSGPGEGLTMNRPFRAGAAMPEVGGAFVDDFLPAVRAFRPGLILISAGFDSRVGDPLGEFRLTDADFATLTRAVLDTARSVCDGRVVSVLEGGYSIPGLASSATAPLAELCRGRDSGVK